MAPHSSTLAWKIPWTEEPGRLQSAGSQRVRQYSAQSLPYLKCSVNVQLFTTPWTAAYQAPLSMGFSRQEYWSGVPLPSPIVNMLLLLLLSRFSRVQLCATP